jgi:hypothetical protein
MIQTADEALAALGHQLGGPPPDGLRRLEPSALSDLADAVADARHRQAVALAAAADQALRFVPRLLRGPIRKILG